MANKATKQWHGCPIRFGSVILGDVWSLLILRDIMFKGRKTYGEFLNAGEAISTNILAAKLTKLEAEGILTKSRDPKHGAKYIYGLTDKGKDLVPVMLEIMNWSEKWDEKTEVPKPFAQALRNDRAALTQKTIEGL